MSANASHCWNVFTAGSPKRDGIVSPTVETSVTTRPRHSRNSSLMNLGGEQRSPDALYRAARSRRSRSNEGGSTVQSGTHDGREASSDDLVSVPIKTDSFPVALISSLTTVL